MQSLFEKIADHWGGDVKAEEIREDYMRLAAEDPVRGGSERFEVFAYECRSPDGKVVQLVKVGDFEGGEPVLVSPIPSAVIAVALR